jgi:hypothetical protein
MAYLGNNLTVQQYAPQVAYFSGNGSTTSFTLPVAVVSAAQIIVTVDNVIQNPSSAYTVSGSTLTFTSAPLSGTNNIWVEYTSLQTNFIQPAAGTVGPTQINSAYSLWNLSGANVNYTAGNVGVGTVSPGSKLTTYDGGAWGHMNGGNSTVNGSVPWFASVDNASVASASYGWLWYNNSSNGNLDLYCRNGSTTGTQVITFARGNGNIVVGNGGVYSSSTDSLSMSSSSIAITGSNSFNVNLNKPSSPAQGAFLTMFVGGGLVGYINYNGTGVNYNSSSDARLKENVVDSPSALGVVNSVKVRAYDWITEGTHDDFGFVAQELYEVYPKAVTPQKNKEDGSMDMPWAVDYAKLVPVLVKAIQEQQAIIKDLKARIEILEAK